MQLYIRSQDKEVLMLINTIALAKDEMGAIIGYGIDGKVNYILGKYETKERALEVLDEVQKVISPYIMIQKIVADDFAQVSIKDLREVCQQDTYVYEMPQK